MRYCSFKLTNPLHTFCRVIHPEQTLNATRLSETNLQNQLGEFDLEHLVFFKGGILLILLWSVWQTAHLTNIGFKVLPFWCSSRNHYGFSHLYKIHVLLHENDSIFVTAVSISMWFWACSEWGCNIVNKKEPLWLAGAIHGPIWWTQNAM